MELAEIFYNIQGESTFAGFPCIFVRVSGCNLRCSYCDTKYAYEKNFEFTVDEVIEKIKEFSPISLVEITGGEPLLQEETYLLINELLRNNFQVLLETNGSILLNKIPEKVIKIMDIKTPTSKMSDKMVWENFDFLNKKDEVKFVISNKADFDWAIGKIKDYDLLKKKVLFSPAKFCLDAKVLAEWILETKMSIRLQVQLHKIIWKNRKGI